MRGVTVHLLTKLRKNDKYVKRRRADSGPRRASCDVTVR